MHRVGARRAGLTLVLVAFCCVSFSFHSSAVAKELAEGEQSAVQALPLDITPEGVVELLKSGTPLYLVDVDRQEELKALPAGGRIVYYSSSPAFGHVRAAVLRARSKQPAAASQRLTGTPLEWRALKLPVGDPLDPQEPMAISPRLLAQALRDGTDVLVLDVRGSANSPGAAQTFSGALALLPDQVVARSEEFPKRGWVVVLDDGGSLSLRLAKSLKDKGLQLVGYLDGGYTAWVDATDRDVSGRSCLPGS